MKITVNICGELTKSVEGLDPQLCELEDGHELLVGERNAGVFQLVKRGMNHRGAGDLDEHASLLGKVAAVG